LFIVCGGLPRIRGGVHMSASSDRSIPNLPRTEGSTERGLKYDAAKPSTVLVSPYACFLEEQAMQYGAIKYAVHNYRKGLRANQLIEAARRHLTLFAAGEDLDRESQVHHLGHVRANTGMYLDCMGLGTLTDDRHKDTAYLEFLAEIMYGGKK
jgi:hypothetical protein